MQASITLSVSNKSTLHTLNAKRKQCKYSLFESLLFKISKVYQLSRDFNLPAYILLQDVRDKIEDKTNYLFDEIERYESILNKSDAYKRASFEFKSKFEKVLDFYNPITCDLIELLTTYDRLISKLKLVSMYGYFQTRHDFIHLEKKYKKDMDKLIVELQSFKLDEIKNIDLNNFEEYSVDELKTTIDHKKLEQALKSNITPLMSDEDYKNALDKIKKLENMIA